MGVGTPVPSDFDVTPGNNTTIDGTNAAEGCPAAGINNITRSLAAAIARAWGGMYSGSSRPASVQTGAFWLDTTTALAPVLKWYDGTDNITFATFDYTANTVSFALAADFNINGLSAETSPAVADTLPLYDASAGANRKMTIANFFKAITALTAETSVALDDELALYDTSASATDKITVLNLMKVVNVLTSVVTLDTANDLVPVYDASGGETKKTTVANLLSYATSPFSAGFTSTAQTINTSGAQDISVAHGLGSIPLVVQAVLRCSTGEFGYAANDEIQINHLGANGLSNFINVYSDATDVHVLIQNCATLFANDATTPGTGRTLTPANWRIVVRAYA